MSLVGTPTTAKNIQQTNSKMKKSRKRLKLSLYATLIHYSSVPFVLIPLFVIAYNSSSVDNFLVNFVQEPSLYLYLVVAISLLIIQYNRLFFYSVLNNDLENIERAINLTSQQLEWRNQEKSGNNKYTVESDGFASWGELITITWDEEGYVYINSICNPYSRPAITAFGRNKKNMKVFLHNLEKLQL